MDATTAVNIFTNSHENLDLFELIKSNKDASRTKATEIYPEISDKISRKKDLNKADAILIARYFFDAQNYIKSNKN